MAIKLETMWGNTAKVPSTFLRRKGCFRNRHEFRPSWPTEGAIYVFYIFHPLRFGYPESSAETIFPVRSPLVKAGKGMIAELQSYKNLKHPLQFVLFNSMIVLYNLYYW